LFLKLGNAEVLFVMMNEKSRASRMIAHIYAESARNEASYVLRRDDGNA
jgi:hypothetical protein